MYGIEAVTSAKGGLAAQAPAGDVFLRDVLGMRGMATTPLIGGPGPTSVLPFTGLGDMAAVNASGTAVDQGPSATGHWRTVLDFHSSPAPWILLGILLLYGWLHLSVRASAGKRVRASVVA
jgi:hypothetical protein